jgi:hypothetical protein
MINWQMMIKIFFIWPIVCGLKISIKQISTSISYLASYKILFASLYLKLSSAYKNVLSFSVYNFFIELLYCSSSTWVCIIIILFLLYLWESLWLSSIGPFITFYPDCLFFVTLRRRFLTVLAKDVVDWDCI